MSWEIVLDIFSGRPNPRWILDPGQEADLSMRLSKLSPGQGLAASLPGLGYRGFIINPSQSDGGGHLRVFNRIIQGPVGIFEDSNRNLERWLLQTAHPFIEQSIADMVLNELNGS